MSEINELADKLKSEGEKFYTLFADFTDEQWQAQVYTEGETWTIRNVLAHFITSERGLIKLFERIRTTGEGSSDDFSIDRYNAAQQRKTSEFSPQELLEQYKSIRADSVTWTLSLEESDLEKQGRHPFMGMTTLREMIKMLYIHNLTHHRDMKKVLK
jgi:hypothetical protein